MPTLDDLERSDVLREALEQAPVAVARDHRDDAGCAGRRVGHRREQPFFPLLGLLVHVRNLDPIDRAGAGADRECGPRVVRVHVHLDRVGVADDEQRVADPIQLLFERVPVEVASLDHEHRAVAVSRELLMDGVEAQMLLDRRGLGKRFAAHGGRHAAHDLHQARPARVDDARILQHL